MEVNDCGAGAAVSAPDTAAEEPEAVPAAAEPVPMNDTQAADAEEACLRAHFDALCAQADELKRTFPKFELSRELNDPAFFKWTAPEGGLSLKQAFMARHGDEIIAAAVRNAVERTRSRTAANVRAGLARPREGGLSAALAAEFTRDPANMTKRERAELRARVARGERVTF